MRYLLNRFRRHTEVVSRRAESAARRFHRTLPGYRPTPLVTLPALAQDLRVSQVLVKDESHRFGLQAFKALGASWAIHRVRERGLASDTLATATAGNHGRAVAWAARTAGLRAVIFMPARSVPARVEAIRGEGAEVVLVDGTYDEAVTVCAERSAEQGWQVVADVGTVDYAEIPGWVVEGYGTMLEEAEEQLGPEWPPDLVLVQAGVGSLAAAVASHFAARAPEARVVVVEPDDADPLFASASTPDGSVAKSPGALRTMMAGLNCARLSLPAWPAVRDRTDLFLTVTDDWAARAMRRFARPAGDDPIVISGESGAAGLAALLALREHRPFAEAARHLGLGPSTRVLLLNTEGATDPAGWERHTGMAIPGARPSPVP